MPILSAEDIRYAISFIESPDLPIPKFTDTHCEFDAADRAPTLWKDLCRRNGHNQVGEQGAWTAWLEAHSEEISSAIKYDEDELKEYWRQVYGEHSFDKVGALYGQAHLFLLATLLSPAGILVLDKDILEIRFLEKLPNGRIPLQVLKNYKIMSGYEKMKQVLTVCSSYRLEFDLEANKVYLAYPVSINLEGEDSELLAHAFKNKKLTALPRALSLIGEYTPLEETKASHFKKLILNYALNLTGQEPESDQEYLSQAGIEVEDPINASAAFSDLERTDEGAAVRTVDDSVRATSAAHAVAASHASSSVWCKCCTSFWRTLTGNNTDNRTAIRRSDLTEPFYSSGHGKDSP